MAANRRFGRLGDIMRVQGRIAVECRSCGHAAHVLASALVLRYGVARQVDTLPFRCTHCGSVRVSAGVSLMDAIADYPRPALPFRRGTTLD